jgi:hypothetical protein
MGQVMVKWLDRNWRLVIIAVLFPILLVPVISVFLFPETPLTKSLLFGSVFSLFVALAFKQLRLIEGWGLRTYILVTVGTALFTLLLIFVSTIWKY